MFTKDLQVLKNKQREMNNRLERMHTRITKAEALGQNCGNHCLRTEYREKNEKN